MRQAPDTRNISLYQPYKVSQRDISQAGGKQAGTLRMVMQGLMERSCIYEHWYVKSLDMPLSSFPWNMNVLINHSSQTTLVLYFTFKISCSTVSKSPIQPIKLITHNWNSLDFSLAQILHIHTQTQERNL